jgi:hypothetical protein
VDEATLATVVMVGLTVALGGAAMSIRRHPDRWSRVLTGQFWLRWVRWTIILTAAGIVGSLAGGGTLLVPVVAIGTASLAFAAAMWFHAR